MRFICVPSHNNTCKVHTTIYHTLTPHYIYIYIFLCTYSFFPIITYRLFFSRSILTQQYTRQYLLGKGFNLHIVSTKPTKEKPRANTHNLYITNAIKYARRPYHFVGFINNDVHWSPQAHVFFNNMFQEVITATLLCNGVWNEFYSNPALPFHVWIIIFSFWQRKSFKSR